MKKIIITCLSLVLLLALVNKQSVMAEENTGTLQTTDTGSIQNTNQADGAPTELNVPQVSDEEIHKMDISAYSSGSVSQPANAYTGNFEAITMILKPSKSINFNKYKIEATYSNPQIFTKESMDVFTSQWYYSNDDFAGNTDNYSTNELVPIKEGQSVVEVKVVNKTDSTDYFIGQIQVTIADANKDKRLTIDKSEINLKPNELAYFYMGVNNPELPALKEKVIVGLTDGNGVTKFERSTIRISVTPGGVVETGVPETKDEFISFVEGYGENLNPSLKKEFKDFMYAYLNSTKGNYITTEQRLALFREFHMKHKDDKLPGIGGGGDTGLAIIPINVGTAYVTFSYGEQSVTLKVNVAETPTDPQDKIPSNITDEFTKEENKSITINLKKSDTIQADVFKIAQKTGKTFTVDIKGDNNLTSYSWTFNGKEIKNPDMALDLEISFVSSKEKTIKKLANMKDIKVISFNHHGSLPGQATIKVYVGDKYKDGSYVYLGYLNENVNKVERVGEKYLVKDGYVEFNIDHCSDYFLSTTPVIESVSKVSVNTGDHSLLSAYIALFLLSFSLLLVLAKRKSINRISNN